MKPVYGSKPGDGRKEALAVALNVFAVVIKSGPSVREFIDGSHTRCSVKFSDRSRAAGEWYAIRGPSCGSLMELPDSFVTLYKDLVSNCVYLCKQRDELVVGFPTTSNQ